MNCTLDLATGIAVDSLLITPNRLAVLFCDAVKVTQCPVCFCILGIQIGGSGEGIPGFRVVPGRPMGEAQVVEYRCVCGIKLGCIFVLCSSLFVVLLPVIATPVFDICGLQQVSDFALLKIRIDFQKALKARLGLLILPQSCEL